MSYIKFPNFRLLHCHYFSPNPTTKKGKRGLPYPTFTIKTVFNEDAIIDDNCVHTPRDSREIRSETSVVFYHFGYSREVFLRTPCYDIAAYG